SNPHLRWENRLSRAARQAVSGYLPYSSVDCCPLSVADRLKWTAGELNPDPLGANQVSFQIGPPPQTIRGVGIEPTVSSFQGWRITAFLPPGNGQRTTNY